MGGESLPGGPDAPECFCNKCQRFQVVPYPHPALRRKNGKVVEFDNRLRLFAKNLFRSMYAEKDGIGLAAPQVGVNLQVMVYNDDAAQSEAGETVFVNPVILAQSEEVDELVEACLSLPRMEGP